MTTWRKLIAETMAQHGETWADVVSEVIAPSWRSRGEPSFDQEFDNGYGGEEGADFCVWTSKRVYFPCCYDGSEWCGSASRNPDGVPLLHQGG